MDKGRDYSRLDELILAEMCVEPHLGMSFTALWKDDGIGAECLRIAKATGRDDFRILDTRLQALKRKGAIRYAGHKLGWLQSAPKPGG